MNENLFGTFLDTYQKFKNALMNIDESTDHYNLMEDKVYGLFLALLYCNAEYLLNKNKQSVKNELQLIMNRSIVFETKYDMKLMLLGMMKVFENLIVQDNLDDREFCTTML